MLVIEYDEQVLLYVREVLAEQEFEVVTARSAGEARRLLAAERPDLVISTFSLPEAERQQIVEAVQGVEETPGVPLLFMATESGPRVVRKWTKAGASGFLNKPFLPEDLLREVNRLV